MDCGASLDVQALNRNCPQHILRRYTIEEVESAAAPLGRRIAELEARLPL